MTQKEVAGYRERIEALHTTIQGAENAMVEATNNVDAAAYGKAKQVKTSAADELEMLEKRLAQVEEQPMITREEYEKMRAALREEYDKDLEKYRKKIAPIVKEVVKMGEESSAYIERIDAMRLKLQREVMKISGQYPYGKEVKPEDQWKYNTANDIIDSYPVTWFATTVKGTAEGHCLIDG